MVHPMILNGVELEAAFSCWVFQEAYPGEFSSYGCGPGGLGDWFVPDTMWGLSVTDACRIHDWDYRHAPEASEEHRDECDRRLLSNVRRIINAKSTNKFSRRLRLIRSSTYYQFVHHMGDFEAVADKILEPGPRPSVLFQTKQLWGLEDSQLTIFRLPGYVDRKNYDQLDNYIFQRCKNWRMYDQTGMEIAHRQQATLPDEGISTLGN
jgi:hypothetical protein